MSRRERLQRYTVLYIETKTGPIPYTVASASSVTGSVFMRRFRLFSGQCNSGTMQSTSSWLHRLKRSGIDYRRQYLNRDAKDIFPHIHTYLGQCVWWILFGTVCVIIIIWDSVCDDYYVTFTTNVGQSPSLHIRDAEPSSSSLFIFFPRIVHCWEKKSTNYCCFFKCRER